MSTLGVGSGNSPPLRIEGLTIDVSVRGVWRTVIDRLSFELRRGEILGVVGESGSGKSVAARAIMRLLPERRFKIVSGSIRFFGDELLGASEKRMRALRGARIAMVFQDPMTALNPVMTVGEQIMEALHLHSRMRRSERRDAAIRMMQRVRIPAASLRVDQYPHQMSGGMQQRAMIAMALALGPDVLIADEPTTALDATVQAQILELLAEIRLERELSIVLISHDLGVIARLCDRVLVMYAGQVLETGLVGDVLRRPLHPYAAGLLESIPGEEEGCDGPLPVIPGIVPELTALPTGCRFHPRCVRREERCEREAPNLAASSRDREVRCHFPLVPETRAPVPETEQQPFGGGSDRE